MELYYIGNEGLGEFLSRSIGVNYLAVKDLVYSLSGRDAEVHLLLLSTGILSPMFGEDTIISQINRAYENSLMQGLSSSYMSRLFNSAVAFGKRMHSSYFLRVIDRTIAESVSSRIKIGSNVLIVGSGEGARMVAETLKSRCNVTMTLRDTEKIFLLPVGTKCIDYNERLENARNVDVVISYSSGLYHTFEEDDYPVLEGKMLFDLADVEDMPSSFGALTIEKMGIPLPEREKVKKAIIEEAELEYNAFCCKIEASDEIEVISEIAENAASDSLRRLSRPLSSLCLPLEKEEAFRQSILDSVRKAVVSTIMESRKR